MRPLTIKTVFGFLTLAGLSVIWASAQAADMPTTRQISPQALVKLFQDRNEKPLVIQVGSHVLYTQAHIPGSEYIGPAANQMALDKLRKRVESLPRTTLIVLYCGCCPWSHCPNVAPADQLLEGMHFTNVKVLYIANNFGADWVDKGYPVAKGD
jgi:thiosulfate/3-mercaptopyruvate sulfurtransferase